MGVTYTKEQQQVIDLRNRNILVSAAAGSGKTAVLVERIITRLTKDPEPIDVDRLLVVTFTEAAAREMKERIRDALEKALEQDPQNAHLQRQENLVHCAQITTIHSFCLNVIRNYFHRIDLDPGFRIGEEGELKLLKHDVLDEVLENAYEEGTSQFLEFVDGFATGRDDQKIEELILQVYEFSRSFPDPKEWFQICMDQYQIEDVESFEERDFVKGILHRTQRILKEMQELLQNALEICREEDGPYMYEEAILDDWKQIEKLQECDTYSSLRDEITKIKWQKLKRNCDKGVSEQRAALVKDIRKEVTQSIDKWKEDYFYDTPEEICQDMKIAAKDLGVLIDLVTRFSKAYAEKKRSKNMIDFNDMEHFALEILTENENGFFRPSQVAREYQEQFREIMIDEYQDSNFVQETILTSVSTIEQGRYNLFMVGDVKQSIYRFRLSRPELFMEKFNTYSLEESETQRIDLHKNFRSRREVLESVNFIFRQIMRKSCGGITYDDQAALYVGADYEQMDGNETEILLIDANPDEMKEWASEETAREVEARAVGKRIKELVGHHRIYDKRTGSYRMASYRDIVILTRSLQGWVDVFTKVLKREGIPIYSGSKEGYFKTREIRTILDFLRILDNPRQDVPLVSVLTSYFGQCTSEELALIKSDTKEGCFYDKIKYYADQGQQKELREKLTTFLNMVEEYRKKLSYTSIHQLIWMILEQTGYGHYVSALPAGEQRAANLDMLVEKAVAFESTSYKGLFHFIRYIEQLHKYDVDYGEATVTEGQEDLVQMMSIHKSKGLEFPIVFVVGMSKLFNAQDTKGSLLLHPKLGLGMDAIDLSRRTKRVTFVKKAIQQELSIENKGEELRVLYVAMTRAREKLILTGTLTDMQRKLSKYEVIGKREQEALPWNRIVKASTYFDWVLPAVYRNQSFAEVLENQEQKVPFANPYFKESVPISCRILRPEELAEMDVLEDLEGAISSQEFRCWNPEQVYDDAAREKIAEQMDYRYPYQEEQQIKQKITVSELKKRAYMEEEEGEVLVKEPESIPLLPKFLQEEEQVTGAARGTVYHKVMERLDFSGEYDRERLEQERKLLVEQGRMTQEEAECIRIQDLLEFFHSSLGKRMSQAAKQNKLWREQPFVLGIEAEEVYGKSNLQDMILLQGIIDAYFEEEDGLVLVDYKTDRVYSEKELLERYRVQLECYAKALTRLTGKPVKGCYIYSFTLHRELEVKENE